MAVIQKQRELLHEVSLPVISVFHGVLVVPLIGELSAERADELIHRLLVAIVDNRAKVAVLDLTGLPVVDREAARALLKAARAIALIGAMVMLVGLSPTTATELIHQSEGAALPESYATLADALHSWLRSQGYEVQRGLVKLWTIQLATGMRVR